LRFADSRLTNCDATYSLADRLRTRHGKNFVKVLHNLCELQLFLAISAFQRTNNLKYHPAIYGQAMPYAGVHQPSLMIGEAWDGRKGNFTL
jgi:hypothetical protein